MRGVSQKMWQIIQGSKSVSPTFFLFDPPFPPLGFWNHDLTSYTDIQCCFTNADGTELTLSLLASQIAIVGNPLLGRIQITLTAAQTALLNLVNFATLQVSLITTGLDPVSFQIKDAYEVIASLC